MKMSSNQREKMDQCYNQRLSNKMPSVRNGIPPLQLFGRGILGAHRTTQVIAKGLGCPPDFYGKILLLNTHTHLVTEHEEIKLVLTKKPPNS